MIVVRCIKDRQTGVRREREGVDLVGMEDGVYRSGVDVFR